MPRLKSRVRIPCPALESPKKQGESHDEPGRSAQQRDRPFVFLGRPFERPFVFRAHVGVTLRGRGAAGASFSSPLDRAGARQTRPSVGDEFASRIHLRRRHTRPRDGTPNENVCTRGSACARRGSRVIRGFREDRGVSSLGAHAALHVLSRAHRARPWTHHLRLAVLSAARPRSVGAVERDGSARGRDRRRGVTAQRSRDDCAGRLAHGRARCDERSRTSARRAAA